eukprot:6190911-Pyramimonas_sp.AAC.1
MLRGRLRGKGPGGRHTPSSPYPIAARPPTPLDVGKILVHAKNRHQGQAAENFRLELGRVARASDDGGQPVQALV